MSYAIRNTIILFITLGIIVGLGLSYYKFFLESQVEELTTELATKQNDFNSKQSINSQYVELSDRYDAAIEVMSNYDKVLYPSNKPDDVFDFLNEVNLIGGNQVYFDYNYSDSLPNNDYGIIQSSLAGFGNYSALTEFVNRIENSQLLNKVMNLTINPARQEDDLNMVNFSFDLESYYERTALFDSLNTEYSIELDEEISTYNPVYPLIQPTIRPNINNLPDPRSSKLVGMTSSRIFLRSGSSIISLKEGDKVYLGSLVRINIENKTATFNLDNGGIQEVVTLEVVR